MARILTTLRRHCSFCFYLCQLVLFLSAQEQMGLLSSPPAIRKENPIMPIIRSLIAVVSVGALLFAIYHKDSWKQFFVSAPVPFLRDDAEKCTNINGAADACEFVRENCGDVGAWISYLEFRYCTLKDVDFTLGAVIAIVIFVFWLILLLNTLGSTADTFFVPALTLVAKEIRLSPAVAGMTLLALGNGAPDIFSAMAGVKSDDFPMVMGALIGAGVCISTFVLGLVVFSVDTKVPKSAFWRNIIGYTVCMVCVIVFCSRGKITIYEGAFFIVLYLVYVIGTVIYLQIHKCRENQREADARVALSRANRGDATFNTPLLLSQDDSLIKLPDNMSLDAASINADGNSDEDILLTTDEEEDDTDHSVFLEGVSWPHPDWEKKSGIMLRLAQLQHLLELPFSILRWLTIPSTHIRPDMWGTTKRILGLFAPIPLAGLVIFDLYEPGEESTSENRTLYFAILCAGIVLSFFSVVYYFFVMLPAVDRYNLLRAEAKEKADKLVQLGNAYDDAVIDRLTLQWDLDKPAIEAKPAAVTFFQVYTSLLAFVASVSWLSIIADEVVAVLQTIGLMFNISTTILGLTVLAIGNSVPDMISNTACAKAGHPEVAMASIFGAPLLTTLVGLGLSLTITCSQQYPTPFTFDVSTQVIVTWSAVLLAALAHMIVFSVSNYRPPRAYGLVLMISYIVFLGVTVAMEVLV